MNRKFVLIALSASLVCSMTAVFAQDLEGFDPRAIEARADEFKTDAQALFDYATVNAEGHQADAQSVVQDGYRSVEGLEVGDLPGENGPVDFDEMIAGAKAGMAQPKGAPLFVAFASLSMPEDALAQMIADTTRAGGVVVFRGFSAGNPHTSITGIRKVVDHRGASHIAIDPRLFRAFNVDRVPRPMAPARPWPGSGLPTSGVSGEWRALPCCLPRCGRLRPSRACADGDQRCAQ